MPTYEFETELPNSNIDQFIETMRQYAGIGTVKIVIEAQDKREAVNNLSESLFEFKNTYVDGSYSQTDAKDEIRRRTRLVRRSA